MEILVHNEGNFLMRGGISEIIINHCQVPNILFSLLFKSYDQTIYFGC